MKRDFELIRTLLIGTEACEKMPYSVLEDCNVIKHHNENELAYHVELLTQHGLILSTIHKANGGTPTRISIDGLTWDGHDYLDAIRSNNVWQKAKKLIKKSVGDVTVSMMKTVCEKVAMNMIIETMNTMNF